MAGGGARISSIGGHSWPPPDDKLDSIFSFLFFSFFVCCISHLHQQRINNLAQILTLIRSNVAASAPGGIEYRLVLVIEWPSAVGFLEKDFREETIESEASAGCVANGCLAYRLIGLTYRLIRELIPRIDSD